MTCPVWRAQRGVEDRFPADVGGWPLFDPDEEPADQDMVSARNRAWTGAQIIHLGIGLSRQIER